MGIKMARITDSIRNDLVLSELVNYDVDNRISTEPSPYHPEQGLKDYVTKEPVALSPEFTVMLQVFKLLDNDIHSDSRNFLNEDEFYYNNAKSFMNQIGEASHPLFLKHLVKEIFKKYKEMCPTNLEINNLLDEIRKEL